MYQSTFQNDRLVMMFENNFVISINRLSVYRYYLFAFILDENIFINLLCIDVEFRIYFNIFHLLLLFHQSESLSADLFILIRVIYRSIYMLNSILILNFFP